MTDDWDDTVSALPSVIDSDAGRGRAYLVIVSGNNVGESYLVAGPDMVIGRAAGVDLRLSDEGVSRFHCRLRHDAKGIVVEDLASRNGTYCNGERVVPGMRPLVEGDRIQVGTTSVLRFTYVDVDASRTPTPDEQVSTVDPMTGTFSRRYFVDQLEREIRNASSQKTPLSLLLVHIDHFAELFAAQGQAFIDQRIVAVANHLREHIRKADLIARIAGGEFAVMLRAISPGDTFMLAQRIRSSSAGKAASTTEEPQRISLSVGVAAASELHIETAHDLLVAAGSALHRARSQGGNRVVLCTQDLLQEPKMRTKV